MEQPPIPPPERLPPDGVSAARTPTRLWSRALVGCAVLVTGAVVAAQLLATFFYNAPANPVSTRYAPAVSWWMSPLETQNWQLFAPNPISENLEVDARVSTGGSGTLSSWVDLSAIDLAATVGDPAPSHLTMNGLRNAWREYDATHNSAGQPTGALGTVSQQYLQSLVLSYLRPREPAPIDSVQVRFIVTLIPGPGRTPAQTAAQTQLLPWWLVSAA